MEIHKYSFYLILFIISLSSCRDRNVTGSDAFWASLKQFSITDFEESEIPKIVGINNAKVELCDSKGVTNGRQSLKIQLQKDAPSTGIEIVPPKPFDISSFKDVSMVFEATNTGTTSIHLIANVHNSKGGSALRSVSIPPGETNSVFFQMEGEYMREGDMRDYPDPWSTNSLQMKIRGGWNKTTFDDVTAIYLYAVKILSDKELILDNFRFVETPAVSDDYLVAWVDKYGQNAKVDFDGKITSDEQLKQKAREELEMLAREGSMKGRTKFGGWAAGPKLEATGYFRTEKVNGVWSLVDPEGYLFFSSGVANCRMANSSTFTGRDFKNNASLLRDPDDVTPEDSKGMIRLGQEITNSSFVAFPERYKMFIELPAYDDALANNYTYRQEHFLSPFIRGEAYSFYQANLERKYGENTPGEHLSKWADVTLDRFKNWGFTSFGNWADTVFYHNEKLPYFANGWIIGDKLKEVHSGGIFGGVLPDFFDPEFEKRAEITVKAIAEEVKDNPWCIGVFIDNEKNWGIAGTVENQYGIVLNTLLEDVRQSPAKAHFAQMLKNRYTTIQALNKAWQTDFKTWEIFDQGIDIRAREEYHEALVQDLSACLTAYAKKYFQVVHDALEKVLPNHLYLGCRFASWGFVPEVNMAAAEYLDVFSMNYYEEGVGDKFWQFLEEMDTPAIIGEFHMGTSNGTGMVNGGLVHAASRQDRAHMYKNYLNSVIDHPYFVGAHWFQYTDSPLTGRAFDGENFNIGFVSNTDIPYPEMVEAAKDVHSNLYERRYGSWSSK